MIVIVDMIFLIVSFVMSKKIAVGVDVILLDVIVGEGVFMKMVDEVCELV